MIGTCIELKNGIRMPAIGYGTWHLSPGKSTTEAVTAAIDCGYRLIDTAYSYGNDFYIGKAIRASGISRDQLFITNKAWQTFQTGTAVFEGCRKSLSLMKLTYFDLYLVHWPVPITQIDWKEANREVWSGMERLYREGYVKAIGVSNFLPHHIEALKEHNIQVEPMVNQIEFHPGCFNSKTVDFCKEQQLAIQGWSPLGSSAVLNQNLIMRLADKYRKSPAQICLRWALQHDVAPIPRSQDPVRMAKNLDVFEFDIELEDMALIDEMDSVGCSKYSPDIRHPEQ